MEELTPGPTPVPLTEIGPNRGDFPVSRGRGQPPTLPRPHLRAWGWPRMRLLQAFLAPAESVGLGAAHLSFGHLGNQAPSIIQAPPQGPGSSLCSARAWKETELAALRGLGPSLGNTNVLSHSRERDMQPSSGWGGKGAGFNVAGATGISQPCEGTCFVIIFTANP